ncbi:hypothetical protein J6X15_04470 [Candidatus Saccharibacteria bacterium]|nr:hypothetical protein [Candidatus Saccharibacteria bacterium]MBP5656806.1 hypothetical protein [Candidatus Saccharibacteria bacterium]
MYEDVDVDATFHIPISSVVKAAVDEAEKRKVAPAVTNTPVNAQPTPAVTVAQTTPVQTVPASPFVPVQYATEATYDDKQLFQELSAVSDEVLECRSKVLNNVF